MSVPVSFEFFPPKTRSGLDKLQQVRDELDAHRPQFYSVTYGAGGTTHQGTRELVLQIHGEGRQTAPHLSIGSGVDQQAVLQLVEEYRAANLQRIVALRGDMPDGKKPTHYAEDLVHLLRKHTGDQFTIEVAAYPETHPDAPSPEADMQFFARKVAAGADSAITQYFYNADAYFDFVNRAADAGVQIPVIPGIMPITNYQRLLRFSEMCGAEIPRWIRLRLLQYRDQPEALMDYGLEVVSELCRRLIDGGAPGLHFYTMNQSAPTLKILQQLG